MGARGVDFVREGARFFYLEGCVGVEVGGGLRELRYRWAAFHRRVLVDWEVNGVGVLG